MYFIPQATYVYKLVQGNPHHAGMQAGINDFICPLAWSQPVSSWA